MANLKEEAVQELPASANISALNCIDISSSDIRNSASVLRQACLDSGFFYVINHGISQDFLDEVFAQSKRFFDLPIEEKMKLLKNKKNRGYTPMLDETLDPDNQIQGDCKEGYYIGVEVPADDPRAEKQFYGQNVWPMADILPGWRETMERYHREALEVGRAVARIIALALDLNSDFFDQPEILGKPIATLRLLHYEGRISEPTKGIYGAGAHTDFGMLTLLATDDVIGLQVSKTFKGDHLMFLRRDHEDFSLYQICKDKYAKPQIWEYVPPLKGAFIVNLGDMLERLSNCVFRSTLHRVLGNGQERYSIPFFVTPGYDYMVECLPTCQSDDNPPKFPPVKSGHYLSQRYLDTHAPLSSYKY